MHRHLTVCKGSTSEQLPQRTQGVRPCQTSPSLGAAASTAAPPTPQSQHSGGEGEAHVLRHSPMLADVPTIAEIARLPRLDVASGGPATSTYWANLDSSLDRELRQVFHSGFSHGTIDSVVERFTNVLRSFAKSVPQHSHKRPSRPKDPVAPAVRARLRQLRRLWNHRDASDLSLERELRHERNVLRKGIRRSLRAHAQHLQNKQLQQNVHAFREDPFGFGKKLFQPKIDTSPSFSKSVADAHFKSVYADVERATVFEDPPGLLPAPTPSHPFPCDPPSLAQLQQTLRKCRNSSTPGPNGIPYVFYKRLPSLHRYLHGIFIRVWTEGDVPVAWRVANMILLAKSKETHHPSLMRNIALSNVEGKLFFSLLASMLQSYMLQNSFFDGRSQKGFLPGVSGCVEHNSIIAEALRHAKQHKKDICLTFVDFANAFGSVRHALIQFALERYHIPLSVRALLHAYYDRLYAQVQTAEYSTEVFHYGIGVFQGCTASPVLFNMVMQILLDTLHQPSNLALGYSFGESSSSVSNEGRVLDPAFADDLTLVTNSCDGSQVLLHLLHGFLLWSTMRLKVAKCMSIAFGYRPLPNLEEKKGWISFDPHLTVGGQAIPVMSPEGCKYLGRRLDPSLSESAVKESIKVTLLQWLRLVDTTQLLRVMKCWLYNAFIIPKLSWFFTIHNLSLSFAKVDLGCIIMPFLKSWCKLPKKGANIAILFCGNAPETIGLSLKPVYTVYKACQVIRRHILQRSRDPTARLVFELELGRQVKWKGRRFAPARELVHLQSRSVNIAVPSQRAGLGYASPSRVRVTRESAYAHYYEEDSHALLEHANTLKMQGKLKSLDSLAKRDWSWQRLIRNCSDGQFAFMVNATNNSLPTGDNLGNWSKEHIAPRCVGCSCGGPTLRHTLGGCPKFLHDGRYTWRHNEVLSVIHASLRGYLKRLSPPKKDLPYISFVRQGEGPIGHQRCSQGVVGARRDLSPGALEGAYDWAMFADGVSGTYAIPHDVAITTLRPDIFLVSRNARKCVLLELTVPFEDRLVTSATRKLQKYQALQREISSNGFECLLLTIEVGSRGNNTKSLRTCLRTLGLSATATTTTCREAASAARRCSYYIYLARNNPVWQ